jgi:hypothetical protein
MPAITVVLSEWSATRMLRHYLNCQSSLEIQDAR